jgi:hypothetical protein
MLASSRSMAQVPGPPAASSGGNIVDATWRDQLHIFTSPARIRKRDLEWLLPLVGATTFLFATDDRNVRERIHPSAEGRDRAALFTDAGLAALGTVPFYLAWQGWRQRNPYETETSVLAARAVADTLIATEAIRLVARREAPNPQGAGDFFRSSVSGGSFPAMPAASAWALAEVAAERYSGWLTKVGVYSVAGGVSVAGMLGRQHSPADIAVGSALGFLIGRYVGGTGHESASRWLSRNPEPYTPQAARVASSPAPSAGGGLTSVPVDSWIYAALDRLADLGLIPTQTSGLRPWTRSECLRQTMEADRLLSKSSYGGDIARIVADLRQELDGADHEGPSVTLASFYTRNAFIAGSPLNDSFHFGTTWIDNNGRPFGRGFNSYDGFTARAQAGHFFAYVNGEFQHAPGQPPDSLSVRETISSLDSAPVQAAAPYSDTNRFRTIEAYAGVQLGDLEVSVGKQALWWGPTYDGPLSFSDNAEPTKNLRISTVHPVKIGFLPEIRAEFVIGKLGGQKYTWRPWFNAQKISFKLTENLEMGFTRWSIFWGVGHPITAWSFVRNFISATSTNEQLGAQDPGDRKGGFDFKYRIPKLRNWLTIYSDSYSDDDPSPLAAPRRAAINPGIHLTHVPGIPRLDFRVEAPSTTPMAVDLGGNFNYINNQYLSGNTNYGNLLGSWVGRDARAMDGWLTYWFSARNKLELGFRHLKGSSLFLPGGSTVSDASVRNSFTLAHDLYADLLLQYEKYDIPVLGPRNRNISGWLQLTWEPNIQIPGKRK